MVDVELSDLEAALKLIGDINSLRLGDIRWVKNGNPVAIDPEDVADWVYVGMTNTYFAKTHLIELGE